MTELQRPLFEASADETLDGRSGSFVDNMKLPVHRWYRYSAGFSAQWVESVIAEERDKGPVTVFDPFAGSGTTLIAAEQGGVQAYGVEAHPFVVRVARAKLAYHKDSTAFLKRIRETTERARSFTPDTSHYGDLIHKCFSEDALRSLDQIRQAVASQCDGTDESALVWLALIGILRASSNVGTAPWQYVLPNKSKRVRLSPFDAFSAMAQLMAGDMTQMRANAPRAQLLQADARTCAGVPDGIASLVITSPPYANNYDYADATRLEMTFLGEVSDWGGLQDAVRQHLMRSCSQHVTERNTDLDRVLAAPELSPIYSELSAVCSTLATTRLEHGGKKNYHLMAACYFADMARVWLALRRVCAPGARVCFVLGDSAPYGVYLPVVEWTADLALAAGFRDWSFEKLRDRNMKWKNRKHRVPLMEGRLWVNG